MVCSHDQERIFPIICLKVLHRSKSVMKSGSILKPRYIRFRVISDRVILGLQQWFLTGGTRTPWGYEALKHGVRNTNFFSGIHALKFKPRHARPENLKNVFSIVVSAVNFIRGHAFNHRAFKVFCNEVGDQHSVLFHTEMRWLSRGRVLTRV